MATDTTTTPREANESTCATDIFSAFGNVLNALQLYVECETALTPHPDPFVAEAQPALQAAEAAQDLLSDALCALARFESEDETAITLLFFGEQLRLLLAEEDRTQVPRIFAELERTFTNRAAVAVESATLLTTARALLAQMIALPLYAETPPSPAD